MNDTPTPQTDYIVSKCQPPMDAETAFDAMNDHAEYLEVKLTAVTEQRDETRDTVESLTTTAFDLLTALENARNERDEAREELKAVTEQRDRLAEAIWLTLMENLDLCDGDICTLKRLKDAIGFDLDSLENAIGDSQSPAKKL